MSGTALIQAASSITIILLLIFSIFAQGFGWNLLAKYSNYCEYDLTK